MSLRVLQTPNLVPMGLELRNKTGSCFSNSGQQRHFCLWFSHWNLREPRHLSQRDSLQLWQASLCHAQEVLGFPFFVASQNFLLKSWPHLWYYLNEADIWFELLWFKESHFTHLCKFTLDDNNESKVPRFALTLIWERSTVVVQMTLGSSMRVNW